MHPAEYYFQLISITYSKMRLLIISGHYYIKRAPVMPVKEKTLLGNRKVELLSIYSSVFRSSKAIGKSFYYLSKMREL